MSQIQIVWVYRQPLCVIVPRAPKFGRIMQNNPWRRQDMLRGGAKMEIMSWGTHGGLQSRVQQLLDD